VVGDWHGNDWFIFEGLSAGEQVVVDGGLTLHPGMPVSVKPFDAGADSTDPGIPPKGEKDTKK